jgi:hypothetical protein
VKLVAAHGVGVEEVTPVQDKAAPAVTEAEAVAVQPIPVVAVTL